MTVTYPPSITPAELTPASLVEAPGRLSLVQPETAAPPADPDPGTRGGDQATLGASVVNLTAQALNQPEVRTETVKQLRAQIAAGTYNVNASHLAEAMLADPLTNLAG
ncbi:MAG: flagellar biosynthesis anti-sigma factor FlgM [Terriglobales bacterium]